MSMLKEVFSYFVDITNCMKNRDCMQTENVKVPRMQRHIVGTLESHVMPTRENLFINLFFH